MNYVLLIGRLTRDVETRQVGDNVAANFTVAIDRPTRDGAEKQADFPRVTVWGKQAENCAKYIGKGSLVAVQGSLRTGSYEDKNGNKVYTTDVNAVRVKFLDSRNTTPQDTQGAQLPNMEYEAPTDTFQQLDEDVPF